MAQIESWFEQDINQPVNPKKLNGLLGKNDSGANLIGVKVYDNGNPVTLSGSCSAKIIRQDGETITHSGTVSGNQCYAVLPATAYAVSGNIQISLKLTQSGSVTTLLNVSATVYP